MKFDKKTHWDKVYKTKTSDQVSWTQPIPTTSLNFIKSFGYNKNIKIIDVGGGDSLLVDFLLEDGYTNITVLDISSKAIEKAKNRLGVKAKEVNWIVSDIVSFEPETSYDIWHDRATFHFLREQPEINNYLELLKKYVKGHIVIGVFSEKGPLKCSGLDIVQYSEQNLLIEIEDDFERLNCFTEDHITPFETKQNFLFCSFKKIE